MEGNIKELLKAQREAKEQPSEKCVDGKQHNFKHFSHADGRECYMNYYRCEHCKEVVVKKIERTGLNKMYWS